MAKSSMMELAENRNDMFNELVKYCMVSGEIDQSLYLEYDVKRGLRDSNGKGVLTGLTEISDVNGTRVVDGVKVPAEGKLFYQGYDVNDLVKGTAGKRYGFEEITYLLLFGELPNKKQFESFKAILTDLQELSADFVRDVILHNPSRNIMNSLQKAILSLYSYDDNPEDVAVQNVLRQCLQLIGKMPLMSVYGYHGYRHFILNKNLVIRTPKKELSTAENILNMLRPDGEFTELEAQVLDTALILHAEHGGGNNSTFTTHVVTSTGTDTYSAMAAAIASLKGPRHGGANLKVQRMFSDLKGNVPDWKDEGAIRDYLSKILDKEAFDKSGLIYGMGHAVYTLSDPRKVILKESAQRLAESKDKMDEFELFDRVERIASELITERRRVFKPVCANVDFYSGFLYSMLSIPEELFTPIFAIARISGWSSHRLEELVNKGKIIRPAYKYVGSHKEYYPIEERFW
ncbi:MAG: citrate/2-methylcitrate synthase [Lachnospiraceae bacterium]|nr:citrate/2-methylcitrate synthase [Lachnospiraceae bacterium]